jgi:predicted component of type VI protein secretion system
MGAVGEQVNVGVAANDFGEAFAELALEVTHDLADSLQGETSSQMTAISVRFSME